GLKSALPGLIAEYRADHAIAFDFAVFVVAVGDVPAQGLDRGGQLAPLALHVVTALPHIDANAILAMCGVLLFRLVLVVAVTTGGHTVFIFHLGDRHTEVAIVEQPRHAGGDTVVAAVAIGNVT